MTHPPAPVSASASASAPPASPSSPSSSPSPVLPANTSLYARQLLSNPPASHSAAIESAISKLQLLAHIEGGYFAETDRDALLVPNPFQHLPALANPTATDDSPTRHASTTIFYLLAPRSPVGYFHRNRGRTVHTLHRGRGVYVLLHMDRRDARTGKVPVETFVVGHDLDKGEKLQWIVEGGKFKASFLIPDSDSDTNTPATDTDVDGQPGSAAGLLISETVVPGFEYADHDFLTAETMRDALDPAQLHELKWLLKRDEQKRLDAL
ncbi:hypothetical protein A1O3_06473 [Capronia epimyces CBS 606.96]|uniref:DUF985 domain-containing protein n=1 Tax=Capronia epimyces CBS 606.96 TaxID=1182542 RepID=W9YK65_9EURO|nr:uncharacterized protein A1O3_06473 [Capronia epimyces CBS 606.96]EXJ82659.1 hypothetical protein A1O3_06473 [Capronia epimyces CBS 606.96]